MKIAVLGGAGVRAPLLVGSLAKRVKRVEIDEVSIFDIDPRKIRLMLPLARKLLEEAGNPYALKVAESPEDAIKGAGAVITTIREGFEQGRARDERICVEHGAIGQETTGPAGFAFACRSIPTLIDYARMTFDSNPDAWLLNFTNPAGLATEALHKEGFLRAIGICDSADNAKAQAADFLGIDQGKITTSVAGLNHLSYTSSLVIDGKERLPELLKDREFVRRSMPAFPSELPSEVGCYLNEYLYYFLCRENSLKAMLAEEKTRGEQIVKWNGDLLDHLEDNRFKDENGDSLDYYFSYLRHRNESYMDYATGGSRYLPTDEEEGYAGVALDFLEAIDGGSESRLVFCVENEGAISGLSDNAVVEVSCMIGKGTIKPVAGIELPEEGHKLVSAVKNYESLAVEAIERKSLDGAIEALLANPLVEDVHQAAGLTADFCEAQPEYFEGWE